MLSARSKRRLLGAALAYLVLPTVHSAAAVPTPVEVNRFSPAEAGAVWFGLDDLNFQGDGRLAVALFTDWAHRPFIVTLRGEDITVVENQVFVYAQAALLLRDRLRLGLSLPVAIAETGRSVTVGATQYPTPSAGLGDLRLSFDVRLFGDAYFPVTAAVGMQLWSPLPGNGNDYGREHTPRFSPHATVAGQLFGYLAYSGRVAILYRPYRTFEALFSRDDELQVAAGIAGRFNSFLNLGVEAYASTALDGDGSFARKSTPVELLIGANHASCCGLTTAVGAGFGLNGAAGTPAFRLLVRFGYVESDTR